jgi:protein-disulfide isomerase
VRKKSPGRVDKKHRRVNQKGLILGIILAVVIIGGSATAFLSMGQRNSNNNNNPTQTSELNDLIKQITQPVIQNASALGSNTAKITIVEFGDYKCQYCARFHRETSSQIMDNYVKTGQVKFLFKDFVINDRPSDKGSTLASIASYCAADQGKYWQYHNELYSKSQGENVGWVTQESVMQFAKNIQIPNMLAFSECLNSQRYDDVIIQNTHLARSLGISSTPTFLFIVQGKKPMGIEGAQPYESFKDAISQIQKS